MKLHNTIIFICISGVCVSFFFAINHMDIKELNNAVEFYKNEINELQVDNFRQEHLIQKVFNTSIKDKPIYTIDVTATAYSARKEECNNNPEITASGNPSRVGVIAISRDLEKEFDLKFGDMVIIENYGLFMIDDRMNQRWKRRIDIMHGNPEAARLFGKKQVKLTWIGKGDI